MKIVFTHTDFRIYWPTRLRRLHSYLYQKEIEMQVVEISGKGSPYEFELDNKKHPPYWFCLFPDKRMEDLSADMANNALLKKLDELQPDVVFSGAIAFPSGAASVRWAKENKKKCVVFDNSRLEDVPRKWYVNFIKKSIYSSVDAIFCPSQAWNETFRFFGFTEKQIFYGLNVVDNEFWKEQQEEGSRHLPQKFFLSIGRQILKKNFLLLLKSYHEYTRNCQDPAELVLVGDGPERQILESYIIEVGLKTIHMLPFTSQSDLRPLYRKAVCFILPSRHGETWGLVVNEAMASGLPVIISEQVGCASTLVRNGFNGFTFSPDDSTQLADKLKYISSITEDKRRKMGKNSIRIIDEWGIDRFCSGISEAISYISKIDYTRPSLISSLVLKLWKGRYRPV
jgi:glycosyltransferase involved in cell wall biosynthesis